MRSMMRSRACSGAAQVHRVGRVVVAPCASAAVSTSKNGSPVTFFDPVKQQAVPVPDEAAPLFTPIRVGSLDLSHRVVMAPLTRCRALGYVPQPAMAEYYSQRATRGGLIISEATQVSEYGVGYPNTPGIHTDEQEAAWRPIVDAVHKKGGVFLCQLWHVGRQSHPDFFEDGRLPVAPSAIAPGPKWSTMTPKSNGQMIPYVVPRALETHEVKEVVKMYADGAKRAMAAGFDGVEIHSANGYLIDQFLKSSSNTRTDEYGGSIENRARFGLEVAAAVVAAVGDAGRVGIRISPFMNFADSVDATPYATHTYYVEQLKKLGLAYVHMTESRTRAYDDEVTPNTESLDPFRIASGAPFIVAGGYDRKGAIKAVANGHADLVAFGRPFVSTPDLPARLLKGVEPNRWDRSTFYTSDQTVGYTDYPFME